MRFRILTILFVFFSQTDLSQTNQIIDIALKDKSNFKTMTTFGKKLPKKFILLETTKKWNTQTFCLDGVDLDNPIIKAQMDSGRYEKYNKMYSNTYYNPYLQTYLFKDSLLNSKINKSERERLRVNAQKQAIKKIQFSGKNYYTVTGYRQINKGYFMTVSKPVFSSDNKYAFISFDIYLKEEKKENLNQYYFGDVTIVYEKQIDKSWKKIVCNPNFIL
jgi:hypothetical protein